MAGPVDTRELPQDAVIDLDGTRLTDARLDVARLDGTRLTDARLDGARLDDAILCCVHTGSLEGRDVRFNRFYDRLAPFYDWSERIGGRVLGVHTVRERAAIVERLGLRPGMRVLEVSPGPGVYQRLIADRIGAGGLLAELDLSLGMLRACARRARRAGRHPLLVQADAARLPFADDSFDAVFHFGGVKLFNDPRQALAELVRVARPEAVVSWGDEGLGEHAPQGWRRHALERMNPGFLEPTPPSPAGVIDERHYEIMNGCAWLKVARKAP